MAETVLQELSRKLDGARQAKTEVEEKLARYSREFQILAERCEDLEKALLALGGYTDAKR
jgi:hypothetical protein